MISFRKLGSAYPLCNEPVGNGRSFYFFVLSDHVEPHGPGSEKHFESKIGFRLGNCTIIYAHQEAQDECDFCRNLVFKQVLSYV